MFGFYWLVIMKAQSSRLPIPIPENTNLQVPWVRGIAIWQARRSSKNAAWLARLRIFRVASIFIPTGLPLASHNLRILFMAEREGFEPSIRCRIHTFQACAFDHSAISPTKRTLH